MSATDTPITTAPGSRSYEEISKDWKAANLRPLWESALAHKVREGGPAPHHWQWKAGPAADRRRHEGHHAGRGRAAGADASPIPTRSAAPAAPPPISPPRLQILLPGEKARPHRHTMNALRFVIEGKGASTVVDGKDCPMEEGDLVITPGWTWHEHVHRGDAPIIWLDALDAPLHRYLGTDKFEPGPAHDLPNVRRRRRLRGSQHRAGAEPSAATPFSPVFRYPWADARRPRCARRRTGRTARGACATSIRSTAARPCR